MKGTWSMVRASYLLSLQVQSSGDRALVAMRRGLCVPCGWERARRDWEGRGKSPNKTFTCNAFGGAAVRGQPSETILL